MLTLQLSCRTSHKAQNYLSQSANVTRQLAQPKQVSIRCACIFTCLTRRGCSVWLVINVILVGIFVYLATCLHLVGGEESAQLCARWRSKCDYLVLLYQDGGSHRKRLQLNTRGRKKKIIKCSTRNSRINKAMSISAAVLNQGLQRAGKYFQLINHLTLTQTYGN